MADRMTDSGNVVEYRSVRFRQTDYRTGSVIVEQVEAPIIARHRDHDIVRLPDGSSLPVHKQ